MVDFSTWLQTEMNKRGFSQHELAKLAGVSQGAIGFVLRGERHPGIDLCKGIAKALRYPPDVVFRAAGILPPAPETDDLIAQFLYELGALPINDKQELLEIARLKRRRIENNNQKT